MIPFFWYPKGYIDLTGDSFRAYYLDPGAFLKNFSLYGVSPLATNPVEPFYYTIPYIAGLVLLKRFFADPWFLIAFTDGLRLSLSFLSFYLFSKTLLETIPGNSNNIFTGFLAIVGAIVYLSFITVWGWGASLVSFNHIFIHPLLSYLLLVYLVTWNKKAGIALLIISGMFAQNFNLTSAPQFFSFFPFIIVTLLSYVIFILKKKVYWRNLLAGFIFFVGLHAFHLLPQIMTLFEKTSYISQRLFNSANIKNFGVVYFETNRFQFGRISLNLFQPAGGLYQRISSLIIPVLLLCGFIKVRSKLLLLLGVGFAMTLFLVAANITHTGVSFYTKLFYVPGFLMFRSFYEKWYFVFGFFYALLATISIYLLLKDRKKQVVGFIFLLVVGAAIYRMLPFIQGKTVRTVHRDSRNVPTYFQLDSSIGKALQYIRTLPQDGKILTLPLTFPIYQIVYGKGDGAFVGISMIGSLTGKSDFSGFWQFGPLEQEIARSIQQGNTKHLTQLLSFFNIRYIFRNNDERILNDFPGYTVRYDEKGTLDAIKDQNGYSQLLATLPLRKLYSVDNYSMFELDDAVVRPLIYVPDEVYATFAEALDAGPGSASVDDSVCTYLRCKSKDTEPLPVVSYTKRSPVLYDMSIDLHGASKPFLIVFSNAFSPSWKLRFDGNLKHSILMHAAANTYANAWIIDPRAFHESDRLQGQVYLQYQNYFYIGSVISIIALVFIVFLSIKTLILDIP